MRAGAREFLTAAPAARRHCRRAGAGFDPPFGGLPRQTAGRKLFVFLGAKGGCGVTTIAANFAVALAQESGQRTLLIDFGLPLGDAAINLGMVTEYSTANALQDSSRLDANFLRSLLAKHSSGLSVLAGSGRILPGAGLQRRNRQAAGRRAQMLRLCGRRCRLENRLEGHGSL